MRLIKVTSKEFGEMLINPYAILTVVKSQNPGKCLIALGDDVLEIDESVEWLDGMVQECTR